jgi:recombination protein RecR
LQRRRRTSAGPELDRLIELLAKLPGLGPRSATRAALHLLKNKERHLAPLTQAMGQALEKVVACSLCGNLDTHDPCGICTDETRDGSLLCVVADVGDLWALERSGGIAGRYHVLGGLLSALDGVRPQDLRIGSLVEKVRASKGKDGAVKEVVLALSPTVDGHSTAHYIADLLGETGVTVTRPAQGMPVGGDLEQLDDVTLLTAFRSRRGMGE